MISYGRQSIDEDDIAAVVDVVTAFPSVVLPDADNPVIQTTQPVTLLSYNSDQQY